MNLQPALRKRLKRFRKRLRRLQTNATAENIHDFRIACREVLACYPLLKDIGPAKRWKPFIKDALDALDRLRDLQQMQEHLLQQQLLLPSVVHSTLEKPIEKATQHWLDYAPTLQAQKFLRAIAATKKSLKPSNSLSDRLQDTFEKQWNKALYLTHKSLLAADASDLESLHRLRIRYKKIRYLLELLENNISLSLHRETLKQWQDTLGDVQDFLVMARLAKELELPTTLQQDFLRRAEEQARYCVTQRDILAQFLQNIDDQVRASL
jgi:CHAD domain-containing protein